MTAAPSPIRENVRLPAGPPRGPTPGPVQHTTVGVCDGLHPGATVQGDTDDRARRPAIRLQGAPPEAAVVALDVRDTRQCGPGQMTPRLFPGHQALRVAVGLQRASRDVDHPRQHRRPRRIRRDTRRDHRTPRSRRRSNTCAAARCGRRHRARSARWQR